MTTDADASDSNRRLTAEEMTQADWGPIPTAYPDDAPEVWHEDSMGNQLIVTGRPEDVQRDRFGNMTTRKVVDPNEPVAPPRPTGAAPDDSDIAQPIPPEQLAEIDAAQADPNAARLIAQAQANLDRMTR